MRHLLFGLLVTVVLFLRDAPPIRAQTPPSQSSAVAAPPVDLTVTRFLAGGLLPLATAQCNDGWFSYSPQSAGTCDGHNGILTWIVEDGDAVQVARSRQEQACLLSFSPPGFASLAPDCARSTAGPCQSTPGRAVLSCYGSGTMTTDKFTVGADWDLAWAFNSCPGDGSQTARFAIALYNADGSVSRNPGITQASITGSGIEHYHTGGGTYLQISSSCSWAVQVRQAS